MLLEPAQAADKAQHGCGDEGNEEQQYIIVYTRDGDFCPAAEHRPHTAPRKVLGSYNITECTPDAGGVVFEVVQPSLHRAGADVGDIDAFFAEFDMYGSGEILQEGFGGSVGAHLLDGDACRYRTHVEDIAFAAGDHVVSEIVGEHGGRDHMEIHDEEVECFGIVEEIRVVVHSGVVDKDLYRVVMCMAIVVQRLGGVLRTKVHNEGDNLHGVGLAEAFRFVADGFFVADNQQVVSSLCHDTGVFVPDA